MARLPEQCARQSHEGLWGGELVSSGVGESSVWLEHPPPETGGPVIQSFRCSQRLTWSPCRKQMRSCWQCDGGWASSPETAQECWNRGETFARPRSIYFCVMPKCDLCVPAVRHPAQPSPATSPDVPASFVLGPNWPQTSSFWN